MNPITKPKLIVVFMAIIMLAVISFVIFSYLDRLPKHDILDDNVLLIYPRMTELAYSKNGFYDYYFKRCDEKCLTIPLDAKSIDRYVIGKNGYQVLEYNYPAKDDLHLNGINLNQYHTIILFHNEYVTQDVFEKITNHPNVIYLYPNSLYALVDVDYHQGTMKLIKGHGYPTNDTGNGFEWVNDNTVMEKDCKFEKWNFYKVNNGIMLDCYPEQIMKNDTSLKSYIIDYITNSSENQKENSHKAWQAWK